jgi:hypothetical protein
MSRHDDDIRLRHVLDAARQAIAFVQGRDRGDLDRLWQIVVGDFPPLVVAPESFLGARP